VCGDDLVKDRLVRVVRALDDEARRLVDEDERVVFVEDVQ